MSQLDERKCPVPTIEDGMFFEMPPGERIVEDRLVKVHEEKDDSYFPRTDPSVVGWFEHELRALDCIFSEYKVPYIVDAGTLLGCVRHGGIVPWDDDVDIIILPTHEHLLWDPERRLVNPKINQEFRSYGLELEPVWFGLKLVPMERHCPTFSRIASEPHYKGGAKYRWPFADIYFTSFQSSDDSKFAYKAPIERAAFPFHFHKTEDVWPIERMKFGTIHVNGPRNPIPYLDRAYQGWRHYALMGMDHIEGSLNVHPVKVCLVDFSAGRAVFDEVDRIERQIASLSNKH
jgi:lipopolysaccharide cholinephosphotransferase